MNKSIWLIFFFGITFIVGLSCAKPQETFTHLGISFQIPEGWEINNFSKDELTNSITLTCEEKGGRGAELVDIHMITKTKTEVDDLPVDSTIYYTISGMVAGRKEVSDENGYPLNWDDRYHKSKLGDVTVNTLVFTAQGNKRIVKYSINGYLACDGITFVYINYRTTDGQEHSPQLKSLLNSFQCKK